MAGPCEWCKNDHVFNRASLNREWYSEKTSRTYEMFDTPLVNADGSISKLKIYHDVTGRKRVEAELEGKVDELRRLGEAESTARQAAETLSHAARAMTQVLDLDQVFETLLEHIEAIMEPDLSGVAFMEAEKRLAVRALQPGGRAGGLRESQAGGLKESPAGGQSGELDDILSLVVDVETSPLLQELLHTHKSIVVPDTAAFEIWGTYPGLAPFRSLVLVPLVTAKPTSASVSEQPAHETVIGVIGLLKREAGYFTQKHVQWVEALAGQAASSIQNAWLFEQVRENSERLQFLARRLVEVQENERRYVAQELHDEVGQALTSLILGLKLIEKKANDPEMVRAEVEGIGQVLDNAMENLHQLAVHLRPAALDKLGLEAALRQHVQSVSNRYGLEIRFGMIGVEGRLSTKVETALYRIVQEALNNIARHAHATGVDILIQTRNGSLILIIEDNGTGFDMQAAMKGDRLGIFGMSERAEMLGGKLTIESSPGKGTTVLVEAPYEHKNSDSG
jgi:signal transduction histidine kinase